ncbi:MAG TPA: Ig-like domain-containing protein [Acidimicrobiales bacterium]
MKKRIPIVRTLLVGAATTTLIAAMAAVFLATPAGATIISPASGATVGGTITLAATGTTGTTTALIGCDTSTEGNLSYSQIELINSGGTAVFNQTGGKSTSGSASFAFTTETVPNGVYTVRDIENDWTGNKAFGIGSCTQHINTYNESITIDNLSTTTYVGATSGVNGQQVTVSAQVTENGGNGILPPSGQAVTFTLSGQAGSVVGTTNANGVASTTLTVQGPPRNNATVTASYNGPYYAASSGSATFTVGLQPTQVTVTSSPSAPEFGQPATFTATVAPTIGPGTPTGTVQFTVDGGNYGSPVSLAGGSASAPSDSALGAGPHTVGAVYSGDANFSGNSGSVGVTVAAATTSTALAANPASTVYGQSVDFTATVTTQPPGAGVPSGTVTFQINGSPFGNPVALNGAGQATSQSISTLGANGYTITAIFSGSSNFTGSSASIGYTVGRATSSTAEVTSATPYAVYGQGITYTATVTDSSANSTGTPTGSVDFQVEGVSPGTTSQGSYTDIGSDSLNGASGSSPTISDLNPGVYNVKAVYGGDSNFTGSSATISQTVTPDTTMTTLNSSVPNSVYGQPVSVTATVTANPPGGGNPTGQVDFQIVNNAPGSTATDLGDVSLSGGSAGIALPNEPAGSYTVTATYEGSPLADFVSSSTTLLQTVNPDPTTTTVTTSVSPSVSGQAVTFAATVSANAPGAGSPTGTVTFSDGATPLATVNLAVVGGSDQASLTTSALSVGTHAITATYNGDDNFVTSNDSLTQTVNQDQTTTVLTQNGGTQPGQPVSFTATVTANAPGSGTPTGTVTFELSGAPIGSPVTLSGGQATSETLSSLTPGVYAITAIYSGDTDFLTSTGSGNQAVGLATTTTTLVASPSPSTYSQAVTLTATVSVVAPGSGTATGTVDFYNGPYLLGSALLSGGQASIITSSLPIGTDSLSASYVGDADYLPSQSAAVPQAVGVIPTTINLATSPNPSSYGQPVALTATVAPRSPYGGTPTGTVTFFNGASILGTAPLAGGHATLTVSNLAVGNDQVEASYAGSATYGGSATAGAAIQTVTQAKTTLTASTLSGSTISATLTTAYGPVAGATVTFTTDSTALCTATTNAQGVASCTLTGLQTFNVEFNGVYTASYAATTDYSAATATGKS